jgi:hypothetical protein
MAMSYKVEIVAVIEFKGLKLNLAQVATGTPSVALVATNIGVRAGAVSDTSSAQILASLEAAVNNEVIIVDLEDGRAWWGHACLFCLLEQYAWADLGCSLPGLLYADQQYVTIYYTAKSISNQWALIVPGGCA